MRREDYGEPDCDAGQAAGIAHELLGDAAAGDGWVPGVCEADGECTGGLWGPESGAEADRDRDAVMRLFDLCLKAQTVQAGLDLAAGPSTPLRFAQDDRVGGYEGDRSFAFANDTHFSDDETVAKMGHPDCDG